MYWSATVASNKYARCNNKTSLAIFSKRNARMDPATFAGFIVFVTVASFTPGPNNVMLASSGATFGFRRSTQHIVGITIGFSVVVFASGLGFAQLLSAFPSLHAVLKGIGILFLLFLSWKIGTAKRPTQKDTSTPLSFSQAAAFQLINPKSVTQVASVIAVFSTEPESIASEMLIFLPVMTALTATSACVWCFFGQIIGRVLKEDVALRRFNIAMAAALLFSLVPIFMGN